LDKQFHGGGHGASRAFAGRFFFFFFFFFGCASRLGFLPVGLAEVLTRAGTTLDGAISEDTLKRLRFLTDSR
jgi:hypothetical protein